MQPTDSNKNKLETIVQSIKSAQEAISRDFSTIPIAARNGFIMAANQAKVQLKSLKREYEEVLLSKSIGFLTTGDAEKQQLFADIASKVGKSIIVDGDGLYKGYATFLSPTIGHHNQFTVNQLSKLEMLMQETAASLDLDRANYPVLQNLNTVNNYKELVAYVESLVTASNGYRLTVPFIRNLISNKAFETGFNSKVLTAVIQNTNPINQIYLSKIFTKSVVVDLNPVEIVNEDFVNKTIRNAFKN